MNKKTYAKPTMNVIMVKDTIIATSGDDNIFSMNTNDQLSPKRGWSCE